MLSVASISIEAERSFLSDIEEERCTVAGKFDVNRLSIRLPDADDAALRVHGCSRYQLSHTERRWTYLASTATPYCQPHTASLRHLRLEAEVQLHDNAVLHTVALTTASGTARPHTVDSVALLHPHK